MGIVDRSREADLPTVAYWDQTKTAVFYATIFALVLLSMFPLIWIFISSLKQPGDLYVFPIEYLPYTFTLEGGVQVVQQYEVTLENYREALQNRPVGQYLINSFIVASGTAILDVILGALAGYALSRLRFRFKLPVLLVILFSALLPFVSRLIPLFKLARQAGDTPLFGEFVGLNTYLGLILPYAAFQLPFAVWIFQAYFKELPDSLEEAGLMDGLSRIGVLFRIILPVSMPAAATAAIVVFIYAWNEFLFALTFMTQDSMRTITVGIALFGNQFSTPWGIISAAVFMSVLPLLLFMFLFQRKIVEGMTAGTGKA
jgi:multiple sugar transport system permease protein